MREQDFYNWLIDHEHKTHNTAYGYARAIDKISEHYSTMHEDLNLFTINDIEHLEIIHRLYLLDGQFSDFGNIGHGTYRNALAGLIRMKRANIR
jgi:hypothetical protein